MSACIVSPNVIARLAVYLCTDDYRTPRIDLISAKTFADVLLAENIKSIGYRYPDTKGKEVETFFVNLTEDQYRAEVQEYLDNPHLVEPTLKQIAQDSPEYDYQACEHPEYEKSLAYQTLQRINSRFVRQYRDKA